MGVENIAALIPIVGIIFGIGIAAVAIVTKHREDLQRNELRHRERLAAIEKGIELPPDPVTDGGNGSKGRSQLKNGMIGLFVGIVLYFALRELVGDRIALFGLVPAAVGLANLIFYFVDFRKNKSS